MNILLPAFTPCPLRRVWQSARLTDGHGSPALSWPGLLTPTKLPLFLLLMLLRPPPPPPGGVQPAGKVHQPQVASGPPGVSGHCLMIEPSQFGTEGVNDAAAAGSIFRNQRRYHSDPSPAAQYYSSVRAADEEATARVQIMQLSDVVWTVQI